MGGCWSGDIEGGKQGIGVGTHHRPLENAQNDAVDFFFRARGQNPLLTSLELSFSASKLLDRDFTSKSDPMAVLYARKIDGRLEEVGRTEVILNNLNPTWIEKITIAYQFEIVQALIIHIYDVDTQFHNLPVKSLNLNDQQFLGEACCVLSEVLTKKDRTLTLNLQNKNGQAALRNLGTITIHAEETIASRTAVDLTLGCSHLDNKDTFSLSDPFLRISRIVESGGSVAICKTEVVDNNLNPIWRPLTLSTQQFGSKENPLIIECFDFNSNGNHVLIG